MLKTNLAPVLQAPTQLQPYGLPTFNSASDAIAAYHGDDQIYALYPQKIARAARQFVTGFPGRVLYAVKANPHPSLLEILWHEGVREFDVASIREMELVAGLFPDAKMYLMHPVKSRATIARAYALGVRDFSFDHADELQKIIEMTNNAQDLTLHLRLGLAQGEAMMSLWGKFGAGFETALTLLRAARPVAAKLGLCFHVGSQCLAIDDYDKAIAYARSVVNAADVAIDILDVGGGFPVAYPDMKIAPMGDYFTAIDASIARHGFAGLDIIGEPGRALCAEGGSTLARIELRKGEDLYLNDGTFGSLFDAGQFAWKFPVVLHREAALPTASEQQTGFRFFGPTCDSADMMAGPFPLPSDAREGDWVEIKHLGAYGQCMATQFNGFRSDHTVAILGQD